MTTKKSLEEPVFVTEIQDIPEHHNHNSNNEGSPSLGMLINVPCGYSTTRNSFVTVKVMVKPPMVLRKQQQRRSEFTGQQHKVALKDEISELSGQLLSRDTKRLTVRRKFILLDFKSAIETKLDPKSSLKVFFTGEPAVDDGGPERQLFSELLIIVKEIFFEGGKPVTYAVALNAGDFKTRRKEMGMSILQGCPAPNFMSPDVASYLVGKPLSPSQNKNPLLRTTSERLSKTMTDGQLRTELTCDEVLDVQRKVGHSGVNGMTVKYFVKWMTGSSQIPPIGFPKNFTLEFVHGCLQGCCCRPTVSTCDITIKILVHVSDEHTMKEMITSAVKDSFGFGLI
ncbi:hypothetical protein AWC38_SpisGene21201 [Stylophora pistillata]|uniref:HECT domain-containing protein n=1 Tax=Stylophora pistillata TaxID=50429 RepID=A0A2B4RE60_STYPI|nr:hypothetical protein AWC38_SpisGene21201 [Stylophora pistillata]